VYTSTTDFALPVASSMVFQRPTADECGCCPWAAAAANSHKVERAMNALRMGGFPLEVVRSSP